MQLRIWTAAIIFIGSYLPLSLILLAQDFKFQYLHKEICLRIWDKNANCILPFNNPNISITIFIFCLICFVITLLILNSVKSKRSIKILSSKYIPSELMNYTLPYVVSFMSVGYNEEGKFLGIIIFLTWIFWITYKSGQIILNPILVAFGWKLYEITYSLNGEAEEYHGQTLSKDEVIINDLVKYGAIQDVTIIKRQKE